VSRWRPSGSCRCSGPAEPADVTLPATADLGTIRLWTTKAACGLQPRRAGPPGAVCESLGLARGCARCFRLRRVLRGAPRPACHRGRCASGSGSGSPLVLAGASGGVAGLAESPGCCGWACPLPPAALGLPARNWLWTYNPRTLEVLDGPPYSRLVYTASTRDPGPPDMPAAAIDRAEARLCAEAMPVFVTRPKAAGRPGASISHPPLPECGRWPAHFARQGSSPWAVPAEHGRPASATDRLSLLPFSAYKLI